MEVMTMLATDLHKSTLTRTLIALVDDLSPDRVAQVIDFARFVKEMTAHEQPVRTPDQIQAIDQLFAGPRKAGLYDALMRYRAEEQAHERNR